MPSSAGGGAISKKRKLGEGEAKATKYYAVRTGKTPGVYTSWDDCKANTYGFKGAVYKSFLSHQDASAFVAGRSVANEKDEGASKFYGLAVGDTPGVYTDWADCQANMVNTKGAKYRKFTTREEAEEFVKDWKAFTKKRKADEAVEEGTAAGGEEEADGPSAKKLKVRGDTAEAPKKGNGRVAKVYTDGSSLGNGQKGSAAGVGVYFGPGDPRNVSEPLLGPVQTNQRAELTAIIRALQILPNATPVEIITDSMYSINCVTDWYKGWARRGWKKADNSPVVNVDLVQDIRKLIDERKSAGGETEFTWVKGHSGGVGNEAADRLAVAGARSQRSL